MNKKQQIMNEIYVHNNKIVKGDLSDYPVIEGKKEEFDISKVKQDYSLAKDKLKELLQDKIKNISEKLNESLICEINRIEKHYETQLKEYQDSIDRNNKRLIELESQLKDINDSPEKDIIQDKINKLNQLIEKADNNEEMKRIINEKNFVIRDEKIKSSLNVKNKLLNTTIIYYPLFCFNIILNGISGNGRLNISYDPLTEEISSLKCHSCESVIKNIYLCSNGHISCQDCIEKCNGCSKPFCKDCLTSVCSQCGMRVCKSCIVVCPICRKSYCKNHIVKDSITGEEACMNCLKICPECNSFTNINNFREFNGKRICQKCYSKEMRNKINKSLFKDGR
jgi:hypothetical protein